MPGQVPVALVSGAATVAQIATDYVDGTEFQIVKLNIGAASADNLFVGGQRDPENSISIVGASGALFNVAASVRGNVAASVAGHVAVSGDGTFGASIVDVSGSIPASVRNQIDVSAHGVIIASVQGNVAASVAGHVLVSADGHALVSGDGTFNVSIVNVSANVPASVLNTVDVSSRQIDVSAHGIVSAAGHVLVSADGHALVSADGHVLVSGDGSFVVVGNVASDAADAGNPVKIGGIVTVSANPASAASGDRVNASFDKVGRQIVVPQQPRELVVQAVATVETAANRTILGSGGAGIFRDITYLSVTNEAATAMTVYLYDGSAGAAAKGIWAIAAGGGFVSTFQPPFKQSVADRVWSVTINPSVASFQYVNIQVVENT